MISRKEFLLGTIGVAGAAACGDSGSGGAGGDAATTGASTKATSNAATSKASSGNTANATTKAATTAANTTVASSTTSGMMFTCATPAAMIGTNHMVPHAITVAAADVAAGVDKTYNIKGQSMHLHMLTVTAAHFATLKETGSVMVTSSTDAMHSHAVTITCAS